MAKKKSASQSTNRNDAVTASSAIPGRFNYEGLERAFHEKARLGIMTSLVTHLQGLSFNDLKDLCSLSDGNLNRHLEVLREAGYVRVEKTGGGRGAKTTCYATPEGSKMFGIYLSELERVIQDASRRRVHSEKGLSIRLGHN